MNDDEVTLAQLRSKLEHVFYPFHTYSTLYDANLFQEVLRVNESDPQEAVIIIDAFHSVKKLLAWQKLLPTVQPHFGTYCLLFRITEPIFRMHLLFYPIACYFSIVCVFSLTNALNSCEVQS